MQIVIDVDEEMYAQIINEDGWDTMLIPYKDIILNGTPLPKGHGRLIDADDMQKYQIDTFGKRLLVIDIAPTIIEADTESEDKE